MKIQKNNLISRFQSFILLICLNFLYFSCSTVPSITPFNSEIKTETAFLIDSKAQIKNENESHNVKIEIIIIPNQIVRLEVTGMLGYKVASIIMTPNNLKYALHTNETYYDGLLNSKSLYPVFKMNIDPLILWKILHNQNPQNKDFYCQLDIQTRPVFCSTGKDEFNSKASVKNLNIKWQYEEPPQRKVILKYNRFEMNWVFKDQSQFKSFQSETLVLKKPEGYKLIVIK